jgi:hypothetical protein
LTSLGFLLWGFVPPSVFVYFKVVAVRFFLFSDLVNSSKPYKPSNKLRVKGHVEVSLSLGIYVKNQLCFPKRLYHKVITLKYVKC